MRAIFVTGTDTEVGKTFICALLLKFFREQGITVGYQKWVSTGSDDKPADLLYCLQHAGVSLDPALIDLQVPYRFHMPASPHLAARLENRLIDPDSIIEKYQELAKRNDILIVEGVGGLLVPLQDDFLLADLLGRVRLPTLIVARSGLGTLNHTLLTIEALRSRKIPVLGVVFSDASADEEEVIVEDNMRTVSHVGKVKILGRLKRFNTSEEAQAAFNPIGQMIQKALSR